MEQRTRRTAQFLGREVELPDELADANANGFLKKEFLYRFSIDTWVDNEELSKLTFPTIVIPLTPSEGRSIFNLRSKKTYQEERGNLLALEKRVEDAIRSLGGICFVKLNHRSPKDIVTFTRNKRMQSLMRQSLKKIDENDARRQAIAWLEAASEALKFSDAKEALIALGQSFRTSSDLAEDLAFPEFFKSKIVIRKFIELDPMLEFRAFVSNRKMTALSQYESGVYFEDLPPKKKEIEKRIVQFFENSAKDQIEENSYVIDFCIAKNGEIYIVELNPFHAQTSGSCFTWKKDREQIVNGPFSFRIVEKPFTQKDLNENGDDSLVDPLNSLPTNWGEWIRDYYEDKQRIRNWTLLGTSAIAASLVAGFVYWKKFK